MTTKRKGEFGMKRAVYVAPLTELFRVELEGNFCASADVDSKDKNGEIDSHKINDGFAEGGFTTNGWD